MVEQDVLHKGSVLLGQPVLPLVGMVQFLYLTGDFATVDEVIAQMPAAIETGYATYADPISSLAPYADLLQPLMDVKAGKAPEEVVVDVNHHPVDALTATTALVAQRILTRELEQINSRLCAPCGCTLCCIGPETGMQQAYFEIPLRAGEQDDFPLERINTPASRTAHIDDEPPLLVAGHDFYRRPDPVLIHWQSGWSLVLPLGSRCPHLEDSGRCRIYSKRPQVCRRPQIFPYMVEPIMDRGRRAFRLRRSLLAVVDCPYVRLLKEAISAYAAACELEMLFRQNKA